MSKAKNSMIFSQVNSLLPKNLAVEKYVSKREQEFKEFILNLKVDFCSHIRNDVMHGSPTQPAAKEVSSLNELTTAANSYLSNNAHQIFQNEFECYQNNKSGIYKTDDYEFGNQLFYHRTTCLTCHGSGEINCQECMATGYIVCGNCHGSGLIHIRDSRTGLAKTQACVHCKNGKRQCGVCSGTGKIGCQKCSSKGSNSTTSEAFFRAKIHFSYLFEPSDGSSEFALLVRQLAIKKLIAICQFELNSAKLVDTQVLLSYKVNIPIIKFELKINNIQQMLSVFADSGEFCQTTYLLDSILSAQLELCQQFNEAGSIKKTPQLYQKLTKIPFIRRIIDGMSGRLALEEVVSALKKKTLGFMSDRSINILAGAIVGSYRYSPKEASRVIMLLGSFANLFIGVYLAFQLLGSRGGFWSDVLYTSLAVGGISYVTISIVNFFWLRVYHSGLPKNLFASSQHVLKRMLSRGLNYVILTLLIGVASSPWQYDYTIKKMGLNDIYAVAKVENTQPQNTEASKPKPKKKKKKHH